MFSEDERRQLLDRLVEKARADSSIDAAALVGSAARRSVDRWSDIDLTLGLADGIDVHEASDRWTRDLADMVTVADTLDVWAGPVLYRVFLLDSSLQVDVSFWPAGTLAPAGGQAFHPVFGDPAAPTARVQPSWHEVAGWGWLYALHARSAIARRRVWQALQMLEGLRGQVIVLACLRSGLETHHGRGVDQLPEATLNALSDTVPPTVSGPTLVPAFVAAIELLGNEIENFDPGLAHRLKAPLAELQASASPRVPDREPDGDP